MTIVITEQDTTINVQELDNTVEVYSGGILVSPVESVNGQQGAVVLDTDDLSEGSSNLYFTDLRATTALTGADISIFNNDAGYITSETDTLEDVTGRGATTTDNITIDGGGLVNSYLGIYGSTDYRLLSTATDQFKVRDASAGVDRLVVTSSSFTYNGDEVLVEGDINVITLDTRVNILSSTPDNGTLAYATDTKQYYIYNNKWFAVSNITGVPNERTSDQLNAGVLPSSSETSGYSSKYITNKTISNSYVGSFDEVNKVVKNGAVRYNSLTNQFQIYIDEWKNVRTLSPLEVANITVYSALKVKDAKGRFMVQHGFINAGALASDYLIDGGTF